MKDTAITEKLKEEKWGYIRPGFYPIKNHSIVPAIVCLADVPFHVEPNVEFVLVKTDCYLSEWEDALLVSEQDYDQVLLKCTNDEDPARKMEKMMTQLVAKGYLPLNKVKSNIQMNHLH